MGLDFGYDYCVRQLDIVRKAGEKLPVVVCERVDLEGKDKRSALLQSFLTANEYVSYYAGTRFLIFCLLIMIFHKFYRENYEYDK